MSLSAKIKGFVVPVQKSLSFGKDKAFENARRSLLEKGVNLGSTLKIGKQTNQNDTEKDSKLQVKSEPQNALRQANQKEVANSTSMISSLDKLMQDMFKQHIQMMDQIFENARKSIDTSGPILKKWNDIVETKKELDCTKSIIPTMDTVFFHNDRFEIIIDARGFQPEDLKCTITPNTVEVVAQRSDKADGSQKNMAMTRSYQLPQNVRPEQGNCCLSAEGILLVTGPWAK